MTNRPLEDLSARVGIEPAYWDVYGERHDTPDETRRAFLSAIGYPADDDEAVRNSLSAFEAKDWQRPLAPVTIVRTSHDKPEYINNASLALTLPAIGVPQAPLQWHITLEDGREMNGEAVFRELSETARTTINDTAYLRAVLVVPDALPLGYHRIHITAENLSAEGALIVAPPTAYRPQWLHETDERVWGVACQLYSLRSNTNAGMGDFSDLAVLCRLTGKHNGHAVGLPPLHALFPTRPELVSPYSPSSRLFLNPIYIDVRAVDEFDTCLDAQTLWASVDFTQRLRQAQSSDAVAFPEVAGMKMDVLRLLFAQFERICAKEPAHPRCRAFDDFVADGGERLYHFALFEALQAHFAPLSVDQWPSCRHVGSDETAAFAAAHTSQINFYLYLQWQADLQLAHAAQQCKDGGMRIGLYRDLAVGVAPNGADAWMEPDAFVANVRFGAPPDPLGPLGQDWGMPPFHPERLYEKAYGPYVEMLRANMRHAGALRIDHVMWLQHLFWIPPGGDGRTGAYMQYRFDDLLAILALESHRNQCLVIGEALGTVPDGFLDRLRAEGILAYCLLQFERYADGLYKRPEIYPHLALATPASHDLPTLAGFWQGRDIHVRKQLGLITEGAEEAEWLDARAEERQQLVGALSDQSLLSKDFPTTAEISKAQLRALISAVHGFMARTPAGLMMMNLEDLGATTTQINVPGTVDEYPNWRQKLPWTLDDIDKHLAASAPIVQKEREGR